MLDETVATMATEATEVIEIIEGVDYTPLLEQIAANTGLIADASVWIQGFLLFFVVVVLCYFAYKFLRIFF